MRKWINPSARIPAAVAADTDFQFLQSNKLVENLSDGALLFLFQRVVKRRYSRLEMIFRDRNPGVCMFLIKQGAVELFVHDEDNNSHVHLANLAEGALFGEIATATGNARTASARATVNDTLLFSISRFDLDDLEQQFPDDAVRLQRGVTMSVVESLIITTEQLHDAQIQIENLNRQLAIYERS